MHIDVKRKVPLYRQLADYLESAIRLGTYSPGDRLQSLRQCAQVNDVSISTVLEAYRSLEDAQLIQSRPNSGHFVAKLPIRLPEPDVSTPPASSATVELPTLVQMVINSENAPDLISFGSGYPSTAQLPIGRVERAMLRAVQRSSGALGRYPVLSGEEVLRQAIARRGLSLGCVLNPKDIMLTSGATESISLCLAALLRPGDTVALESPTSFGFLQILEALKLRALEIPTHPRYGLSVDALSLLLRESRVSAVLATPTLSNPMGTSMPVAERKRLVELLCSHRIPMIEDVIYNDLAGAETHRRAVKSFDHDGWILLCSSYSKTIAPGLRVGWLHAGRFGSQVRMLKSAFSGGNCSINEIALSELLTDSNYNRQLRRLHKINRQLLFDARQTIGDSFPTDTRVTNPTGGSMLWVELPGTINSLTLFTACLDERILIAPGILFSASGSYRNCIRLCISGAWGAEHRRALRRIGELASELLKGVVS